MICSASCDWITLTKRWKPGEVEGNFDGSGTLLRQVFDDIALVPQKWASMGYNGQRCEEAKVRYGSRIGKDGTLDELLSSSGSKANDVIDSIPVVNDLNCTRFDLQATAYLEDPVEDLAEGLYNQIKKSKMIGESMTGRRSTSLVMSDTGATLYVGKRGSGRKFFRLYDKSAAFQCPLGQVWRQEVEYGRRYAKRAWEWYKLRRDDQGEQIRMVNREFEEAVRYSLMSEEGFSEEVIPEAEEAGGTIERKLEWMRTCVAPSVAFLMEHSHGEEAMRALGLGWALEEERKS